ncbi:hypothetical protein DNU06_08115 [Putridiphycobacter roseus]|uniref:Orphan protein n=1 Tax=Putridiphycobacter roseus TaxID=2219161 RepID=A0A2W1MYH0_9FLAO|nr:DUF6515 family protein [Putridiphycobacter roseus]PZE17229.1 hypothetical protein DNU06_08115 [Putridiphycobacter roseus]
MKTTLKITLAILLLIGFSSTGIAQKNKPNQKTNNKAKNKAAPVHKTSPVNRSKVQYKSAPKKVVTVRNIPNNAVKVKHNGQTIFYTNNKFYRQNAGRYIPAIPAKGFRIKTLPVGYTVIVHNNRNFYYQNGIYFIQSNKEYEVINPELGTIVSQLPADSEKVVIDGFTYFEYNNVLYEKIQMNGTRAYEVIGFIEN